MIKISLTFVAAAFGAVTLATTADAAGCHNGFGRFGGGFRQSYASSEPSYIEQRRLRQRRALAASQARAQPRTFAVKQPSSTITPAAAVTTEKAVASSVPALKKGDLQTVTTVAKTITTGTDGDDVKTVVAQACRKFSPAVGGLVETACN